MVLHVAWVGAALLLQQANKLRLNFCYFVSILFLTTTTTTTIHKMIMFRRKNVANLGFLGFSSPP